MIFPWFVDYQPKSFTILMWWNASNLQLLCKHLKQEHSWFLIFPRHLQLDTFTQIQSKLTTLLGGNHMLPSAVAGVTYQLRASNESQNSSEVDIQWKPEKRSKQCNSAEEGHFQQCVMFLWMRHTCPAGNFSDMKSGKLNWVSLAVLEVHDHGP